ncbi:BNR/Asp-box repeat protein [Aspergillus steynii IBT 23096]|uniref:BNR/Asp-box repeat protein n=1 Tax=Aspergillus steynii IBT 23096 TaxID=1392250 RepID=A0A2I2GRW4_9EURO|nr:BNR/Asp-box repeat protein [Aspergillus steynii IBT 23096]PLB55603.1 BNR/Asp-box repeat protein [Aspergillus steynii IBT 23096]
MHFLHLLTLAPLALAASISKARIPTYSQNVIFSPPSDYTIPRTLYARNEQLPNGDLLATWENYSPEPPAVYFPIYRSKDHGQTWKEISRVHDTANGLGLRYQPFLYYLPERVGSFKKGTLLLAGSSIPTDLSSTQIDLYASRNSGKTWEFVSHIAAGGEAVPNNGLTPVWEPFLLAHKGKLIAYYADQRKNETHGQHLSHQVTTDLKNWSPATDDTAYPTYTDRPGMPVVAKLPNGKYIYVYEYGSFFNTSSYSFPIYYRISADPENFNAAPHQRLVVSSGTVPTSSPYVVWTPYGGKNGTIIVSAGTQDSIFINQALGEGEWTEIATPEGHSYTRSLRVLREDPSKLLLHGAGVLLGKTNKVTVSVMDLKKAF